MPEDPPRSWEQLFDEFHTQIGYCITEWAVVDNELFRIFQDCLGGPIEQAAIAYYRTPALDLRFGLTDEIVQSALPKKTRKSGGHDHPSIKVWKVATADFKKLLAIRRRIAHHPVMEKVDPPSTTFGPEGPPRSWFEIYVGQHEQLRSKSADLPALAIDDLNEHWRAVYALSDKLRHFYQDVLIKRREEPLPPTPQQNSVKSKDRA
jgi:hypothetical protein